MIRSRERPPTPYPIFLDVTDEDSIASAAKVVEQAVGDTGLDGLVNNAGIAVAGRLEFLPIGELRRQLEVNVIGQIAVTQAFLPLLRKSRGRIVNVGSISSKIATPLLGPYSAFKFALDALTSALRMELKPSGIHVAIVNPATVATPIWRKSLDAGDRLAGSLPPETFERYGPIIPALRKTTKLRRKRSATGGGGPRSSATSGIPQAQNHLRSGQHNAHRGGPALHA